MDYDFDLLVGESSAPVSMKQAELYGNIIPFNEPSGQFSTKYAELYTVPPNAKYPEFYMPAGPFSESFYPVDTPNIIPNSSPAADFKQLPQPEAKTEPNNDSEMDSLLNSDGFSLSSLLSMPVNEEGCCVDGDPLNLLGLQSSMDEMDLLNPIALGCARPDGIHYVNGFQKDCGNTANEAHVTADPLMTNLYGLPSGDKKNVMDTNSPLEPPKHPISGQERSHKFYQ